MKGFCARLCILSEITNINLCILREEDAGYNPEALLKKAVKTSAKSLKVSNSISSLLVDSEYGWDT